MIEQNYQDKIEEIKQHADALSEWENGYIFGGDDSRPIWERDSLSSKQKDLVDRIFNERVKGEGRQSDAPVGFGNDRISAIATDGKFRVVLDGMQVGQVMNRPEAIVIVGWISQGLTDGHITMGVVTAE